MIPVVKQSVILRGFETHPLLLPETNSHSLFVGFVLLLKGETRTEHESGESTSNSLSNVILSATLEEHGVTKSKQATACEFFFSFYLYTTPSCS